MKFQLLILFFCITVFAHSQNIKYTPIYIGEKAPSLYLSAWLKGSPIERFSNGQIYVVEFWATWCRPCKAAMPRLSALKSKFKDKVTFIGVDIYEKKGTPVKRIKAFVDSMGGLMDYNVAIQDSNFMETHWMQTTAGSYDGIPKSFVIDSKGRLAWTGHPKDLEPVLSKIVNGKWDLKEALDKWKLNKHLDSLDYSTGPYLNTLLEDGKIKDPIAALAFIGKITSKEPLLKHSPNIVNFTFGALLQLSFRDAYEYGLKELSPTTYWGSNYEAIISNIKWYSDKLTLPPKIYHLGALAYQMYIDNLTYPEIMDMPKIYRYAADLYLKANDTAKANECELKANKYERK